MLDLSYLYHMLAPFRPPFWRPAPGVFFFQAEDGIRDIGVTGVQTCALPISSTVAELGQLGLATVLVGDDPASHVYIRLKHKAATEVGMHPVDTRLPADVSEDEVISVVEDLNADDGVDGLLVQLP